MTEIILNPGQFLDKIAPTLSDKDLKERIIKAMNDYAKQTVLQYARWFEDQGVPEYKNDDWMVKENVESFWNR